MGQTSGGAIMEDRTFFMMAIMIQTFIQWAQTYTTFVPLWLKMYLWETVSRGKQYLPRKMWYQHALLQSIHPMDHFWELKMLVQLTNTLTLKAQPLHLMGTPVTSATLKNFSVHTKTQSQMNIMVKHISLQNQPATFRRKMLTFKFCWKCNWAHCGINSVLTRANWIPK